MIDYFFDWDKIDDEKLGFGFCYFPLYPSFFIDSLASLCHCASKWWKLFCPFHIAKGRFYIHNAYVFRKRIIPLNNIKKIEVHFIPSVKLNGARYFLCIQQKSGKSLAFFFGKSKENDQLVNNLKNETKKYNIKIRILES